MKYNRFFALCLLLGSINAHAIHRSAGEEAAAASQIDEVESLMDKYDKQEEDKNKPKQPELKTKSGKTVTKNEVQDMELRILTGNDIAESSKKAYDDDLYNAAIEKFQSDSKTDKDAKILTKENA